MSSDVKKEGIGALLVKIGSVVSAYSPALGGILQSIGYSLIISGAADQLGLIQGAPNSGAAAIQSVVRSTTAYQQVIYGQVKAGGVLALYDTSGTSNEYLHIVVTHSLATAPGVDSITDVYIDDVRIPDANIDGSGNVSSSSSSDAWHDLAGNIVVERHTGASTQTADTTLTTALSYLTSAFRGRGIAYTYFQLYRNPDDDTFQKAYPHGIPNNLTCIVNGQMVYDPRLDSTNGGTGTQRLSDSSTWTWSSNPALCLADYLTRAKTDGGAGFAQSLINWSCVAAAANTCDTTMTTPEGSLSRFSCNISLSTGDDVNTNVQKILDCMAGVLIYTGGQICVYAGSYTTPSDTVDETWLRGTPTLLATAPRNQRYNAVSATFTDPFSDYQTIPAAPVTHSSYETQDGGVQLWKQLALPGVNDQYQAQYLEQISSAQSRNQKTIQLPLNLKGLTLQCWNTINLSIDELGLSSASYRIINWTLNADGGVDVIAREEASTTYDVATFTTVTPASSLTSAYETPPVPTSFAVTATADGNDLTWTPPAAAYYTMIEIWRAPDVAGSSGTYAKLGEIRGGYYRDPITSGTKYWYKIRSRYFKGQHSAYTTEKSAKAKTVADGADVTADNTANDTVHVNGKTSSDVQTQTDNFLNDQSRTTLTFTSGDTVPAWHTIAQIPGDGSGNGRGTFQCKLGLGSSSSPGYTWRVSSNVSGTKLGAIFWGPSSETTALDNWRLLRATGGSLYLQVRQVQATALVFSIHVEPVFGTYVSTQVPVAVQDGGANSGTVVLPTSGTSYSLNDASSNPLQFAFYHTDGAEGEHSSDGSHWVFGDQFMDTGGQIASQFRVPGLWGPGYADAYWTSLTFTPHPTSMDLTAGTLHLGEDTSSYNSGTIGSLSNSTTYSFYCQDRLMAGGSWSGLKTTSKKTLINNNANVYFGDGTTTDGSGGGGSGGPGACVAAAMYLHAGLKARHAHIDDWLSCAADFKLIGRKKITAVSTWCEECVRIEAENGCAVVVSASAPFTIEDLSTVFAPDMLGRKVLTDLGVSTVIKVEKLHKSQQVMRISCGGLSYAAGERPDRRIYSHNTAKQ